MIAEEIQLHKHSNNPVTGLSVEWWMKERALSLHWQILLIQEPKSTLGYISSARTAVYEASSRWSYERRPGWRWHGERKPLALVSTSRVLLMVLMVMVVAYLRLSEKVSNFGQRSLGRRTQDEELLRNDPDSQWRQWASLVQAGVCSRHPMIYWPQLLCCAPASLATPTGSSG